MTTSTTNARQELSDRGDKLSELWFTRCPVPTATGLAYKLGWLSEAFEPDGITISTLQDGPAELAHHHFDHGIPTLFREGGNVPALAARALGAPTRVVGLTWIEEWQTIQVRPDSGITEPGDLRGLRVALPAYAATRGGSIARAMTLHGVKGALSAAGLTFDDVRFVEVPATSSETDGIRLWAGLEYLAEGTVDAVYVKGASAVEVAALVGAVVGVNLDRLAHRRQRVNNGTPRPITVHQSLLDDHFDLVVRFLEQGVRAADFAAADSSEAYRVLEGETRAGPDGVAVAYGGGSSLSLHPSLDEERVGLVRAQKDFLLLHGFLEHDVDVDEWVDRRPLEAALKDVD